MLEFAKGEHFNFTFGYLHFYFVNVAGAGFEPASSRLWALRAAAALPRDKNTLLVYSLNGILARARCIFCLRFSQKCSKI